MEKKNKFGWFKKVILIILILTISLIPNFIKDDVVFADSGFGTSYDSGGSDFGSSDYGSSSSWDYDDDYSGGGSIGSSITSIIIFIIIMIIITNMAKNSNKTQNTTTTQINDNDIENKIKQYIPNFNKNEFLKQGYNIYLDVQNAWMNFSLDDVKDKITDELYNMYDSQLSTLEVKGEQNIMKDFALRKSYLKDVVNQNNNITITAGYVIELYDYIIEQSTEKVLRGFPNNKLCITYEMKFRRTLDESAKVENCPNCGAKIDMNSSGICEYCGSKIVLDNCRKTPDCGNRKQRRRQR